MRVKIPGPILGAIRIVGLYLLIGFLWILFSDQLASLLVPNRETFLQVSTYKGWGYVLVTGILLFILIKNHTDRLSAGETWLRMAYDAADMGTWRHDMVEGRVRFDERARRHYGFGELEVPIADLMSQVHSDDVSRLEQKIAGTSDPAAGGRYTTQYRVVHADGSVHWLEVEAHVSFEGVGGKRRPVLSVGTSRDITESKQADLQIHYFARLYATLSQVNQIIVRCNDQQELFESICRVAVEFGEFRLAWIGLLDEETGMLLPVAEYGFQENKLPFHQIDPAKKPFRDGLIGPALRSGRVDICNDIQVEPHMIHWQEIAVRDHYHSAAAVPIRRNARVIGLLNLYAADIDFFMVMEEQKLLEEMGLDISFALDAMQLEAEHRESEKQLIESEKRYHQVLDTMMEGCQIIDFNWRYIYLNDAAAKQSRYQKEELLGRTMMEMYPGIENSGMFAALRNCMENRISVRMENEFNFPDGSVGWFELSIQPVEKGIFILSTDITERKLGEERLRESEERFRQLADNIEEAFWIFDLVDKKDVYVSPAVETIWMRPVCAFYDNPDQFIESVIPEDRPKVQNALAQQARGMKTDMEYRISRPDGSIRWVWDRAFPVFDENGKLIRVAGILADYSENKKAEMELLELNQNLEQRVNERTAEVQDLYENSPSGYHSLDANGMIVRINQTELNWLGYSREEIVGVKSIRDLFTVESQKTFAENFPRFKAQGWIRDLEFEMIRKDGSTFPVLLNSTAIYNEKGEFFMSRSTLFDITERKHAELQLQAANVALEKASKLKDEFLANMSHELRTPLNAIIGLSESLQANTYGELNPRQGIIMNVIGESGRHLLELINDILDLSKIEAGMMELQYETVNLRTVCEASLLMVNEPARKKELQVSISITDEIQTIQADQRRLKQMLVNLLSNAVKFTPPGGSMGLEALPENDHAIRFTVWDTGIGISTEHLKNLFKPFVQVDSSLAREYEGTGLGLALVSQLAEMHNGSVGVESTPEKGSRFSFIIPKQSSQNFMDEEVSMPREMPSEQFSILPSSVTILLVEDNPTNMMFTGDYLTAKGFNLITAENGLQAIGQMQAHKPNLILMDIQMPELDGIETIRRLRSVPEFATVPIIALTALAMPGDRERCLEAGASEYLAKPISLKKLVGMISSLLK